MSDTNKKGVLHYSEVISVSDGRLVAHNGMDGVYKVCDAVAGPGVTTIALTFLAEPVKQIILAKYPTLGRPEVKRAVDAALADFKVQRTGDRTGPGRVADDKLLAKLMDAYVLPLMPSEYLELEHMGEEALDALMNGDETGYKQHLDKILKDKDVIVVVMP